MEVSAASRPPIMAIRSPRLFLAVLAFSMSFATASEFMVSATLQSLAAAFQSSSTEISWLLASYALSYVLAAPFLGYVSDRIDRVRLFRGALFLFSLAEAGMALSPSISTAISLRILSGMASAALIPTSLVLITELFRPDKQTGAMGTVMFGVACGIAVGPALAGILTDSLSWRAPFLMTSTGSVLCLGASLFSMPTYSARREPRHHSTTNWYANFRIVRPLLTRSACNGAGVSAFLISGEVLRWRYDLGATEIGFTIMAFGLGIAAGNVSVGWLRRRCQSEENALALATIVLASAITAFMLTDKSLILSFFLMIFWGAALGAIAPLNTVILAARAGTDKGAALAFAETLDNIFVLVAVPIITGVLMTGGAGPAMVAISIGLMLGISLALGDAFLTKKQRNSHQLPDKYNPLGE